MKSTHPKNIIPTRPHHSPFFQKESKDHFFKNSEPFFGSNAIQAKLTVNQPDDIYEKEADATADEVVQRLNVNEHDIFSINAKQTKPIGSLSTITPSVQAKCAACDQEEKLQKKEQDNDDELSNGLLQTKPIFDSNSRLPGDDENIQRKCAECDHEDKVQTKAAFIQRKEELSSSAGQFSNQQTLSETQPSAPQPTSANEQNNQEGRFIVDDGEIGSQGKMRKSIFLERLNTEACTAVEASLQGMPFSSRICNYIRTAFASLSNNNPLQIEQAIQRYEPSVSSAQNAEEIIQRIKARIAAAATRWARTQDFSGLPEEIIAQIPPGIRVMSNIARTAGNISQSISSGISSIGSGIRKLLFKENPGGARAAGSPASIMQSLGKGNSMEAGTRSQMESAFGTDFSGVEVHTDNRAADLSANMNARAFTVGNHIAFGSGQYKPGTLAGDALMAHELAHVQQQKGMNNGNNHSDAMLEEDADQTALGVMTKALAGKDINPYKKGRSSVKSGLRLSRCGGGSTPPPAPAPHTEHDPGTGFQKTYIVPSIQAGSTAADVNTVQVSPGEQMIFRLNVDDTDRTRTSIAPNPWTSAPGTGPYEIDFAITGDAELDARGSGTMNKRIASLDTGNVYIFIKRAWNRTSAITVTATVKDNAGAIPLPDTGSEKDPDKTYTWHLVRRAHRCPTSLRKTAGPGAVWVAAPASYTYQAMPGIPPAGRPDYEGQTVLERFKPVTALGFTMSDLTDAWKAANPAQNTPNKVARFLWNSGGNGTFVFNHADSISDRHDGFGDITPFKPSALNDANGIGYRLPQEYVCGGRVIGSTIIDRRMTTAHSLQIRKTPP